ncbi:MAG TPA: hypothetical protein VKA26_08865 [Ignavibacteriaceae bacterium]|nr:hypothetical protein [Ignavibacteriaceae bacterium]
MIIASIDIGTNTVLLLLANVDRNGRITTILDEYRIPRIGKSLSLGNEISDIKIQELLDVLDAYKEKIEKYNCDNVLISATNAFRIANNSGKICQIIKNKFGWDINVISEQDEAMLSFLGAITNKPVNHKYLVIDIGGGSTELIFGTSNLINYRKSFQVGVVSGSEKYFKNDPPKIKEIADFRGYLGNIFNELKEIKYAPDFTIALAGTPTTLACIKNHMEQFDEQAIENSELTLIDVKEIIEVLSKINHNQIKEKYGSVVIGREDLILAGSIILCNLMILLNLVKVKVSTKGIRYGAIVDYLNKVNLKPHN